MITPNGKRYAVEWAEAENYAQDYGEITIYRSPLEDTHTETIRFKGFMHKSGQHVDEIPAGVEVWFRFSAMAPDDGGEWPFIKHEGKKILFIEEEEMICWRHPQTGQLIACRGKIIFEPVYESDEEIMKGGIFLKSTREIKKSLGKAISGKDVSKGDEFVYWSAPNPVHIDLKTTIYSIYYQQQYVHNRTSGHYNPDFVILKPLDEEKEWEMKKNGLWLPANTDVTNGLAEVIVDNHPFKKGETVIHSKRTFNQIPYSEKVYAVKKHMVYLAIK